MYYSFHPPTPYPLYKIVYSQRLGHEFFLTKIHSNDRKSNRIIVKNRQSNLDMTDAGVKTKSVTFFVKIEKLMYFVSYKNVFSLY